MLSDVASLGTWFNKVPSVAALPRQEIAGKIRGRIGFLGQS
jgi:hypothetical protein